MVDVTSGYIGIFNEENTLDNYQNIDRSEGKVSLKTPLASGKYTVRLIWEDTILVESEPLMIQGKDTLSVEYIINDTIVAKVKILSFDPFWGLSWIGLYKSNEKLSTNYLQYFTLRSVESEFVFTDIAKTNCADFEVRVFPKFGSTVPTLVSKLSLAAPIKF